MADELVTEPKTIANCFNNYFNAVADKLVANPLLVSQKSLSIPMHCRTFYLNPTTEVEVARTIMVLKKYALEWSRQY